MLTKWVCTICLLSKGITGRDLANWPTYNDEAAIAHHLREEHGITVMEYENDNETLPRSPRVS